MGQSPLGTSQFVPVISQLSQSFLVTSKAVLLFTKSKNIGWSLVSITTLVSLSDLNESFYDSAAFYVS